MRPATIHDELHHDDWWHEDDVIHQAEGMIAVQLAVTVHEAGGALRAYSTQIGVDRRDLAGQVVRHEVFVPRNDAGREGPQAERRK